MVEYNEIRNLRARIKRTKLKLDTLHLHNKDKMELIDKFWRLQVEYKRAYNEYRR